MTRHDDEGSAVLEVVLLAPVLILILAAVVGGARVTLAHQRVDAAKGINGFALLERAHHFQAFQRIGFERFLAPVQIRLHATAIAFRRRKFAWSEWLG